MSRLITKSSAVLAAATLALGLSAGANLAQDPAQALDAFLPDPASFPVAYSSTSAGPQSTAQLGEWWGAEVEDLLNSIGREAGFLRFYDLEDPTAAGPRRILVVIEDFAGPDGPARLFATDFPGGFRGRLYQDGRPLERTGPEGLDLSAADAALVLPGTRGEGDTSRLLTITLRLGDKAVLVQGQDATAIRGARADLVRWVAARILDKLVED